MNPLNPELQPGSIRAQLHTASFVTISAVLALVLVVVLGSEYLLGRQRLVDDLRVQADMVAAQSSAAIIFSDVALVGSLPRIATLPILSEESADALGPIGGDFWLVDPLDGTKEFIKRTGEFTVTSR